MRRLQETVRVGILVAVVFMIGCQKSTTSDPRNQKNGTESKKFTDGLTAEAILDRTVTAYRTADGYSDAGLLYLSYRLHGSLIQEQQPWRTMFQRPNRIEGDWYNAKVRSDGSRLGCFIFDNDTANLDNQWLVLDGIRDLPVAELLQDPIARHFLTGESELPLRESRSLPEWRLIPPVVGLLTGQAAWQVWEQPGNLLRLEDALVDERPCFHLQLKGVVGHTDWWIDKETSAVRQMTLPAGLLDPAIQSSTEVAELQFFARFHECRFLTASDLTASSGTGFKVAAPGSAKPVRHFIALPEDFPSETIGQKPLISGLKDLAGQPANLPPDTPSILVWPPELPDQAFLDGWKTVSSGSTAGQLCLLWSARHLEDSAPAGPLRLFPDWTAFRATAGAGQRSLADPDLSVWKSLKLRSVDVAVLLDREGKMHYVTGLHDPEWGVRLKAAAERVAAGDDVASEMKSDYEKYLETYLRRLAMVSVDAATGVVAKGRNKPAPEGLLPARKAWECRETRSPGNLVVANDGTLVALDGWRSILELDPTGKVLRRKELELPPGIAVDRLILEEREDQRSWAAFSSRGPAVFLFDQSWQPVGTVRSSQPVASGDQPSPSMTMDRVVDCRFLEAEGSDAGGTHRIAVAWEKQGVLVGPFPDGPWAPMASQPVESLAIGSSGLLGLVDGKVVPLLPNEPSEPLRFSGRVTAVADRMRPAVGKPGEKPSAEVGTDRPETVAVGMSDDQFWTVALLHTDQRTGLEAPVGPQLFGNPLEPLCVDPMTGAVAVADSHGTIRVFDRRLKEICRLELTGLEGLAISGASGRLMVYTSHSGAITAWEAGSTDGAGNSP